MNVGQFIELLQSTGLCGVEDLRIVCAEWLPNRCDEDAQPLARYLVEQGKLTKYQAAAVYQNKTKGLVLGNYALLDRLGAGGMGTVFKAVNRSTDTTVAIKLLSPSTNRRDDRIKRFQREAATVSKLNHPNIVRALETGAVDHQHYLVMEYVEGADLAKVIKKQGPLKVDQAVHVTLQAARALAYAHGQGVIHRDIKPGNLFLTQDGLVKLLDLGLARLDDRPSLATVQPEQELTQTGDIMGTVDYMAPEQAMQTRLADARADIYSLGCTFYRLLTGTVPFPAESVVEKIIAHREWPIPSLRAVRPEISEATDRVFQRALAKRVDQRFQTMSDFADALEQSLTQVALATPIALPVSGSDLPGESSHSFALNRTVTSVISARPRNRRALIGFGALAAAVLVGIGIFQVNAGRRPDEVSEKVVAEHTSIQPSAKPSVATDAGATNGKDRSSELRSNSASASIASPAKESPTPQNATSATIVLGNDKSTPVAPKSMPVSNSSSPVPPNASAQPVAPVVGPAPTTLPPAVAPQAPATPARSAVPDDSSVAGAVKVVRDLFKAEYAKAKQPEERIALAKVLYDVANRTDRDPLGRFTMLREARDLAAEGGDPALIAASCALASKEYEVDEFDWLATATESVNRRAILPSTGRQLANALLSKIDEAMDAGREQSAGRLMNATLVAARKTQDVSVIKAATDRKQQFDRDVQQIKSVAKAQETLASKPDDPAANTTVGKHLCFFQNNWNEGLKHLAKGNDNTLKELAEKSLGAGSQVNDIFAVADFWWSKSEKAAGQTKKELQFGALVWYEKIASTTNGLQKAIVDKRIAEAREATTALVARRRATVDGNQSTSPQVVAPLLVANNVPKVDLPDVKPGSPPANTPPTNPPPPAQPSTQAIVSMPPGAPKSIPNSASPVNADSTPKSPPASDPKAAPTPAPLMVAKANVPTNGETASAINPKQKSVAGATPRNQPPAFVRVPHEEYLEFAMWVFERHGSVYINSAGTGGPVDTAANLPNSFAITSVTFNEAYGANIGDDDLRFLSAIPWLGSVRLKGQDVTDDGIAALVAMPRLHSLDVTGAKRVTDASFARISTASELKSLNLVDCSITGSEFHRLAELDKLDRLRLNGASIATQHLLTVAKLPRVPHLTVLDLSDTALTGKMLAEFGEMPQLTHLWMSDTRITDVDLSHLRTFPKLTALYLCGCPVTFNGLAELRQCDGLKQLYLDRVKLTAVTWDSPVDLHSIENLSLQDSSLSAPVMAQLVESFSPRALNLRGSTATDELLPIIAKMPRLTRILVGDTKISEEGIKALQLQLPECTVSTTPRNPPVAK